MTAGPDASTPSSPNGRSQFDHVAPESVEKIASHQRWSIAYNVRLALLRNPLTSLGRVLALAPEVKRRDLVEISGDPRMPDDRRNRRSQEDGSPLHRRPLLPLLVKVIAAVDDCHGLSQIS